MNSILLETSANQGGMEGRKQMKFKKIVLEQAKLSPRSQHGGCLKLVLRAWLGREQPEPSRPWGAVSVGVWSRSRVNVL